MGDLSLPYQSPERERGKVKAFPLPSLTLRALTIALAHTIKIIAGRAKIGQQIETKSAIFDDPGN